MEKWLPKGKDPQSAKLKRLSHIGSLNVYFLKSSLKADLKPDSTSDPTREPSTSPRAKVIIVVLEWMTKVPQLPVWFIQLESGGFRAQIYVGFQSFTVLYLCIWKMDILRMEKKKAYLCKSVSRKDSGDLYLPWTKAHTGTENKNIYIGIDIDLYLKMSIFAFQSTQELKNGEMEPFPFNLHFCSLKMHVPWFQDANHCQLVGGIDKHCLFWQRRWLFGARGRSRGGRLLHSNETRTDISNVNYWIL